jgi:hypothetical protein
MTEKFKPQNIREYLQGRIDYYESGESPTPPELYDVDCDRIVAEELKKALRFVTNGTSDSPADR